MKLKAISIMILLLASNAFLVLPIPDVGAANPVFDVQTNGVFTSTNTGTSHNSVAPANAGELIVVTISTEDTTVSTCGSERTVTGVTDSTGSVVFTELTGGPVCSATASPHVGISDIWYGLTFSTTGQTITVTMSGSTAFVWFTASFYTLLQDNVLSSSTGSCQSGNACAITATTSQSIHYDAGDVVVGDATSSSGDMSSAGSGFTALNYFNGGMSGNVPSCAPDAIANFCFQYITPSSSSSTNFPANLQVSNRDYSDIGVVFGPAGSGTVVVPCTPFQLQCWWYPLLFYGVYSGAFMMIGAIGRASQKGMGFLLLASLAICSIIQVMMGLMNIMPAVAFSLLGILYAVRFR